jgi:hypothetical protein
MGIPREAAYTQLDPRVTANTLRLRESEVLHDSKTLCMRTELGVPKTGAPILICICKRKFVSDWIFLQKTKGAADADVVVCLSLRARRKSQISDSVTPCAEK